MKFLLPFLLLFQFSFGMNAQVKPAKGTQAGGPRFINVRSLCYEETQVDRIRVSDRINLDKLTIADQLKFVDKRYSRLQSQYLNASGAAVKETKFISHTNMFPEWYVHPTEIIADEKGTFSVFNKDNPLLPDGWTGGTTKQTENGTYEIDARTGRRQYAQPYSRKAQQAYDGHNRAVKTYGFLYRSRFSVPSPAQLKEFIKNNFTVTSDASKILVGNGDFTVMWDLDKVRMVTQQLENNIPVKTTTSTFEYFAFCKDFLITKEVSVTPHTFESGDCYDIISQTFYKNYGTSCLQSPAKKLTQEDAPLATTDLTIFPNPATDQLNVEVPNYDGKSDLRIYNLSGQLISVKQIASNQTLAKVDIENLTNGMYLIKVYQGAQIYSNKFIKQ